MVELSLINYFLQCLRLPWPQRVLRYYPISLISVTVIGLLFSTMILYWLKNFLSVFRIRSGEYIWILWGYPVSRSHEMVRRLFFIAQDIVHSSGPSGIKTFLYL